MQWSFLIFNTKTNHSHRILPFDSIAINMLSMGIEHLQHLSGIYHVSISCQRTRHCFIAYHKLFKLVPGFAFCIQQLVQCNSSLLVMMMPIHQVTFQCFVLTNWKQQMQTNSRWRMQVLWSQFKQQIWIQTFFSLIFVFIWTAIIMASNVLAQNDFRFITYPQGLFWALACIIQIYPDAKIPHIKGEAYTGNSSYEPLYTKNMPVEFMINGIVSGSLTLVNVICIFITAIVTLKIKEVAAPYTSSPDLRR